MQEYLQLTGHILDNGHDRGDRTGVGTRGVFGFMQRFNLLDGTIPLLTTKRMHLRGIIHELLWFIAGDTSANTLAQQGVKIWDPWALDEKRLMRTYKERLELVSRSNWASNQLRKHLESLAGDKKLSIEEKTRAWLAKTGMYAQRSANSLGDLGFVYGGPWRRLPVVDGDIIQVAVRQGPDEGPMEPPHYVRDASPYKTSYSGDLPTRWENNGNPFQLIADMGGPNNIVIQFIKTGAIKIVSRESIVKGIIADSYAPKLHGVACMGIVRHAKGSALHSIWLRILARCYDKENTLYRNFGAKGAYVSPRWLCFENFYNDVKRLPGYERWANDPQSFDLTKDYYGSQCYDVSTCIFAPTRSRTLYGDRVRVFRTISPRGVEKLYIGLKAMSRSLNVLSEHMDAYLAGQETPKRLRGWLIEEVKAEPGYLYRQKLYIDQLDELIQGLKNNPFSRRHIVTAWIPQVLPNEKLSPQENVTKGNQCLAACHCMFQFFVRELNSEERLMWYLDNSDTVERSTQSVEVDATVPPELAGELGVSDDLSVTRDIIRFPIGVATGFNGQYSVEIPDYGDYGNLEGFLEAMSVPKQAVSCMLIQRSSDVPIGVPYNWASYAILTRMVAQVVGMAADEFVWVSGDTHIYNNQFDGVREQMQRDPFPLPKLRLNPRVTNLEDFAVTDFRIEDYKSHGVIRQPIAV